MENIYDLVETGSPFLQDRYPRWKRGEQTTTQNLPSYESELQVNNPVIPKQTAEIQANRTNDILSKFTDITGDWDKTLFGLSGGKIPQNWSNNPVLDTINQANIPLIDLGQMDVTAEKPVTKTPTKSTVKKEANPEVATPKVNPFQDLLDRMGDTSKADAIRSAMDNQRKSQIMSMISGGLDRLGRTMAGGNIQKIEGEDQLGKLFQELGAFGVDQAKTDKALFDEQTKNELTKISTENELQKFDANSEMSKMFREDLKRMGYPTSENATYAQLEKIYTPLANRYNAQLKAKEDAARRAEDREFKLMNLSKIQNGIDQRYNLGTNGVKGYGDKARQEMKPYLEMMDSSKGLLSQLELARQGNQVAVANMKAQAARVYEKGVMTDADVERYTVPISLLRKAQQKLSMMVNGKVPDLTLEELEAIQKVVQVRAEENAGERTWSQIQRARAALIPRGVPEELIYESIDPDGYYKKYKMKEMSNFKPFTINGREVLLETEVRDGKVYPKKGGAVYNPETFQRI